MVARGPTLHMDDDCDITNIPFYYDDMLAQDDQNVINLDYRASTAGMPATNVASIPEGQNVRRLRQNLQEINKLVTDIESLLKESLNPAARHENKSFWSREEHQQFLFYLDKFGR